MQIYLTGFWNNFPNNTLQVFFNKLEEVSSAWLDCSTRVFSAPKLSSLCIGFWKHLLLERFEVSSLDSSAHEEVKGWKKWQLSWCVSLCSALSFKWGFPLKQQIIRNVTENYFVRISLLWKKLYSRNSSLPLIFSF